MTRMELEILPGDDHSPVAARITDGQLHCHRHSGQVFRHGRYSDCLIEGRAVASPVANIPVPLVDRPQSPPPNESSSLTAPTLRSGPSGDHSFGSGGAAPMS